MPDGCSHLLFIEDEDGVFRLYYREFFSYKCLLSELKEDTGKRYIVVDIPEKVSIGELARSLEIHRRLMRDKQMDSVEQLEEYMDRQASLITKMDSRELQVYTALKIAKVQWLLEHWSIVDREELKE